MAKFRAIVNAVRQAITGNATTADVLSGKTFMSSASPNEQTGAMTNNGAVTASLTADGQVYTIPAGYHDGTGTVSANISMPEYFDMIYAPTDFHSETYHYLVFNNHNATVTEWTTSAHPDVTAGNVKAHWNTDASYTATFTALEAGTYEVLTSSSLTPQVLTLNANDTIITTLNRGIAVAIRQTS